MMLESEFDFSDLVVFEMANNHQGDVEHGLRIIEEMGKLRKKHNLRAAMKFQFRDLDTFIHPKYKDAKEPKHISRFLSTKLSHSDFQRLFDATRKQGLLTMCTPFDEVSVDRIEEMGFDIIKIGSCSAKDWPLLERVSDAGLPVILSTGGLTIEDIDNLESFSQHRGIDHAIMHCVSVYPTPPELCEVNQIEFLSNRYPNTTIGWSTHEDPNDHEIVMVAYAKGARIFEKHVGLVEGDVKKLNAYSATPEQLDRWLEALNRSSKICGESYKRECLPQFEIDSLKSLQRGVYAKRPLKAGTRLDRQSIFFAMPYLEGQSFSGSFKEGTVLKTAVGKNEPILESNIEAPPDSDAKSLKKSLHEVKAMLNEARIPINSDFRVEYSHHHGVPKFRETGCVIIDLVNRSYCKKILVQLPGQRHPLHFHKKKEETFIVLSGELHVEIDGQHRVLSPGQKCLIQPGVWHGFWTETGAIFEEISSTHYNDDSFYKDRRINKMKREERKTIVDHWGRFVLNPAKTPPEPSSPGARIKSKKSPPRPGIRPMVN